MAIKSLNPYIILNGKAEEAQKFYASVLGAKTEEVTRFDQIPGGADMPKEMQQRIMHSKLVVGDAVFMLSDAMGSDHAEPKSNIHIVLHFTDVADLQTKFDALAVGGKVTFPVHDAFFGGKFGNVTDQFGVEWMVICQKV